MTNFLQLDIQNKHLSRLSSSEIGDLGETIAAKYLEKNGFRLVLANYKVPIGRNRKGVQVSGEIDIIALEKDVLCFVEVKTRTSDEFASPLSAVDIRKQRQITRTARIYRKIFNLQNVPFRYDVVSIILGTEGKPQVDLFKNFWNEAKFRKKVWNNELW